LECKTTFTAARPSLEPVCRSGASPYHFEDEDGVGFIHSKVLRAIRALPSLTSKDG
jgi:hypothetical protein